jgi:hypothetical protein
MELSTGQIEFRDDALAYAHRYGFPVWEALRILVEQNGDAEIRDRYGISQDEVQGLERLLGRVHQAAAGGPELSAAEWRAAGGFADQHPTGPVAAQLVGQPAASAAVAGVVAELDAINTDPELAEMQADELLLTVVPAEVADAYRRALRRNAQHVQPEEVR